MITAKVITYSNGKLNGIEYIGGFESVKEYMGTRYERWLEYSAYQCSRVGKEDEAVDLLNEVIISLLEKDEAELMRLCSTPSKCKKYMEMDVLTLRMIYLNCHSETAPYRAKNKPIPGKTDLNLRKLHIIDEPDEPDDSEDRVAIVSKQMRLVRWIALGLDLTDLERRVFEYRFFEGELFSEWEGPETQKQLYYIFHNVQIAINEVLYYKGLTHYRLLEDKKSTYNYTRINELAEQFVKTHRINGTPAVVLKQISLSNAVVLKQTRLSKWVFQGLSLTKFERDVFKFSFFDGKSLSSEWHGTEKIKELHHAYNDVQIAINEVLFYYGLINFRLIDKRNKKLTKRQEELAQEFVKTHKVSKKTKNSLQLN